ncbi:MAG: preprotein translocase subunit YajC, partial [Mycobacteriales bacterium]
PTKAATSHASTLGNLLLPAVLLGAVLLFVRANRRARQRAAPNAAGGLEVGREVLLRTGIFGTVTGRSDDVIFVEVAPGVIVRVVEAAVGRVLPLPDSSEAGEDGTYPVQDPRDEPAKPDSAQPDQGSQRPPPASTDESAAPLPQPDPAPPPVEDGPDGPAGGWSTGTPPSP